MIFENPMSAILRYQPYNGLHDKDDYVSAFDTTIEVDEGDLVLFPGYLMHKTEKNMSSENRIILGFNIRHEFVL
jgi:ectoine hydroxylase-related dioxygenase (phytanoyl-CoA dioxygenase family)